MTGNDTRDLVLGRIRSALSERPDAPSPGVKLPTPWQTGADLVAKFVESARAAGVDVRVARSVTDVRAAVTDIVAAERAASVVVSPGAAKAPWHIDALDGVEVTVRGTRGPERDAVLGAGLGVTVASFGLADTGTLVVYSSADEHRLDSLLPPVHVALLPARAVVPGLGAVVERLQAESRPATHSAITFIRGPSRTADIELTLTVGVHGPRRVYCVVCDDGSRS